MASLPPNISNTGVVIIHSKLKDSVIISLLSQKQIKFRTSDRLLEGTILFPKAKLAFLVVEIVKSARSHDSNQSSDSNEVSETYDKDLADIKTRVEKFIGAHSQCVVILKAPLFTPVKFKILSRLQSIYVQHSVDFLPAHSAEDCINAMLTLVSVQTPPSCDVLHDRMCDLMNSLLQPPPFLTNL